MITIKFIKVIFLIFILGFSSCAGPQPVSSDSELPHSGEGILEALHEPESPEPTAPLRTYLNIVAVGDNLVHHPIFQASYQEGVYDFHYIFDHIRDYIIPADIAFINQETILGNEELGFSGYPRFSTPPEMGTAVAAAGFNVINFANNHALDRGAEGIMSSIDYLDNYDEVYYLGIHRSAEERAGRQVILEINNFTVGFLAYTFSTNGIPFPSGRTYLVSMIDRETMAREINALRPHCDYLVVSMHWGAEYALNYNRGQEDLARFLADQQVDLVIGHHPHVLQPMVIMTRSDGRPMPVFYSLGNFLSSHARSTKEALLGGIMYVRLSKTGVPIFGEIDWVIEIEEIGLIPIITHFDPNRSNFGVYPLHIYTDDLAAQHWRRLTGAGDPEMTVEFFINAAREMFDSALIMRNVFAR